MMEPFSVAAVAAFFQVVMIDLVLAGDNAVVIGLAAAGLPQAQRAKAILTGIVAAAVLRIGFATVTAQLLNVMGLVLAGGILLLWVCWKMWRELRDTPLHEEPGYDFDVNPDGSVVARGGSKTFVQAASQIVIADVSMSLDNVLAVAGAAREHPVVLVFGLILSVALMGVAASLLANVLKKHRWIAYAGLAVILYVALDMIYRGVLEVGPAIAQAAGL